MSRVGKQPISLPDKVTVKIGADGSVLVEGPKGKLNWTLPEGVSVANEGKELSVTRSSEDRRVRAMHGTSQRLISNMIEGVSKGYTRNLEIHGVGFRAAVKGNVIDLNLGQSHPRLHPIPEGVKVTVADNTKIAIEGIDKQVVGQLAADIRAYYPPEPYKAKGVRYAGEQIRRKAGKSVK
ncbi:large subunit ribosomal protein L6 [Prosthecobacter fusiformis]|uniref:Large ribosomal subunit protein uL6 n=1 Tax=Prosthecobacter fusiformis TaxID=48464 RepID=A0A4R7RIM8_9BACT|nr:50S ribosomal protein L6 [Prosthecobacter fusiformis]TDU63039.1 large subunit ribosomal protein L6 [Prosthecobacter fusiformis]